MIPLREELEKRIEDALWHKSLLDKREDINTLYKDLNQVIVGSPGSGKTLQAQKYAEELEKADIISKGNIYTLSGGDIRQAHDLPVSRPPGFVGPQSTPLSDGRNMIFVFDELGHMPPEIWPSIVNIMVDIVENKRGILVLTDNEGANEAFMKSDKRINDLFTAEPIIMPTPPGGSFRPRRGAFNFRSLLSIGADTEAPMRAAFKNPKGPK